MVGSMSSYQQLFGVTPASIQVLNITSAANTSSLDTTLPAPVDMSKSVAITGDGVMTFQHSSVDRFTGSAFYLTSNTNLRLYKKSNNAGDNTNATVFVIDFGSMVKSVQTVLLSSASTSAALSPVDTAKCVVFKAYAFNSVGTLPTIPLAHTLKSTSFSVSYLPSDVDLVAQIVEFW